MSLLGCLDLPEFPLEKAVDSFYHLSIFIHLFECSIQSIPIVNKLTMTICPERPLVAHTSSEGVFKSSMLLLHPNVAEEVEQEASI